MLSPKCARHVLEEIIKLYPNAETVLTYRNHFELLIAVMLSAQTTDLAVNKVTPALFERFPDPAAFSQSSPEEIAPYIQSIGLYKNKSKYIYQTACRLMEFFQGEVPDNRKELESLPGVGRKTANVILSVAFQQPAFPVDTHVSRVCKHHQIVPQDANPRQIEDIVVGLLEPEQLYAAHHALIFFGREVCHPRKPQCHLYPQLYTCNDEIID